MGILNRNENNIENRVADNQTDEIKRRGAKYSALLTLYVKSTSCNAISKLLFKWAFFVVTMLAFWKMISLFEDSVNKVYAIFDGFENLNEISTEVVLGLLTIVLPAVSSLIVAFINIPKIIAQYLFNNNEDDNMNSIIKNIQDYDRAMFAMEQKVKDLLSMHKSQTAETKDEEIMEFNEDEEVGDTQESS